MCTPGKFAFVFPALLLLALFLFNSVEAQPFGMMSTQGQKKPENQVLSSQNGRFVFGQISDSTKDQFMLDTLTGRLWRISERGDIGVFLIGVPYCDSDGKCHALPDEQPDSGQSNVEGP